MTQGKQDSTVRRFSFRGMRFRIPAAELAEAVRQTQRLHDRVLDALVEEAQRVAALEAEQ